MSKRLRRTPTAPQFTDILERVSLYLYTNPILPPALYQLIAPRPPNIRLTIQTGSIQTPGAATISDDASSQSGVSALTGNTGDTTRTQQSKYGTPVSNPNLDPTLVALLPPTVRIKDLIGNDEPPKNETGGRMCLSFHLRGLCFTNCRRTADHTRPLTQIDKTVLFNWVIDTLAKWRAAGTIP